MGGTRRKGPRRGGGAHQGSSTQTPATPTERQEAADRAQSLRRGGEELIPATKLAKSWGVSIEAVRGAIAETEVQPDQVIDNCAYYSAATAKLIREHLKQ